MQTAPSLVFDLDGTLVDTAPDLQATINTILAREGRRPLDGDEIRRVVGRGARNLIVQAFALTGAAVEMARVEGLYAEFLEDYGNHIAAASRPFPGVIETLQVLQAEGMPMAVLTNKPQANTLSLIRALDMERYFTTVFGQGKRPYIKPDPRLFTEVAAELGGGPAVMVGDSITDVQTARGAGAPVILMSYGYTPEPAASLGADVVLDDFREVSAAAARLLGL